MKLSVIIPIYNSSKYLEQCLDSVIYNKKNIEIILINDGSSDNSLDICKSYQNKDNRIKIINNFNHGVSYSRNCGIKNATGDYIMFVDSDDYLDKSWLDILQSNYNEDVIYFNEKLNNCFDKETILKYVIGINNPCIAGPYCKLFKTLFLKKQQILFQENVINGEDMLFNIEALKKNAGILKLLINQYTFIGKSQVVLQKDLTKKYLIQTKTFINI